MPPTRGRLFLVPFLYSDLRGSKRRPACVVSADEFNTGPDVIVAMVTSSASRRASPQIGDVVLRDWKEAGLLHTSVVRTGRLQVLERRDLTVDLGELTGHDLQSVNEGLVDVLQLGERL